MSDIHALSGAYAVDALDDLERARFERHLGDCDTCREEVQEMHETLAVLAENAAVTPPAQLRERVLADIARVRPLPPEASRDIDSVTEPATGPVADPVPGRVTVPAPRRRRFAVLAAAAAAVIAVGGGVIVWQQLDDQPGDGTGQVLSATERVLQATDAAATTQPLTGGGAATLTRSVEEGAAVLETSGLPDAPSGRIYQLWLSVPGVGFVSAGLMDPTGDQVVLLEGDAAVANGAGITVEPAGGSTAPTTDPLTLFDFAALEPV